MGDDADIVKWFDEDAIRILEDDPEPRMRSGALAEVLQHGSHQGLARLIERHRENLNEINRVVTVTTRHASGGHEFAEYWLTEPQCIYLAAKSETEVANRITVVVVKQFDMYRKGLLVANGPHIEAVIRSEFQNMSDLLRHLAEAMRSGFAELRFVTKETHQGVTFCVEELRGRRKELTEHTLRVHRYIVAAKFNSECPICRVRRIVVDDAFVNAAAHHHITTNNANFDATIVICVECHKRFHDPAAIEFREIFHRAFNYYQDIARGVDLAAKREPPCRSEQAALFEKPEKIQ